MSDTMDVSKIVLGRLEDQLQFYDKKSQAAQFWYKRLRLISLVAAAFIPFLSALTLPGVPMNVVVGLLGIVITICQGIEGLNQYQQNWMSYRSTAEALKHEKYAYLAQIGDYANAEQRIAMLADKIESLISTEHTKWVATQQALTKERQGATTEAAKK